MMMIHMPITMMMSMTTLMIMIINIHRGSEDFTGLTGDSIITIPVMLIYTTTIHFSMISTGPVSRSI